VCARHSRNKVKLKKKRKRGKKKTMTPCDPIDEISGAGALLDSFSVKFQGTRGEGSAKIADPEESPA